MGGTRAQSRWAEIGAGPLGTPSHTGALERQRTSRAKEFANSATASRRLANTVSWMVELTR